MQGDSSHNAKVSIKYENYEYLVIAIVLLSCMKEISSKLQIL